jgi:hypothetical protein
MIGRGREMASATARSSPSQAASDGTSAVGELAPGKESGAGDCIRLRKFDADVVRREGGGRRSVKDARRLIARNSERRVVGVIGFSNVSPTLMGDGLAMTEF